VLPCSHVKIANFLRKVVFGRNKNGRYYACDSIQEAENRLGARRCSCVDAVRPAQRDSGRTRPAQSADAPRDGNLGSRVVAISDPVSRVAASSWERLNLEPSPDDPRYVMRRKLVRALRETQHVQGMILSAVYESAVEGAFDSENILYCNVDPTSGAFAHLAAEGLRFERSYADPRSEAHPFAHRMIYELLEPRSPSRHWSRGDTFAAWCTIQCPDPSAVSRAAPFWWLFRTVPPSVLGERSVTGKFGIRLVLDVPAQRTCKPAALLKPAIDGATSALACDDGSSPAAGIALLAGHLGQVSAEVTTRLHTGPELLGRVRLLDKAGRMQAPDSRCVFGELLARPTSSTNWRISASLFEVAPAQQVVA